MKIDTLTWEPEGYPDPLTRLLTTIWVEGCPMHLEARQVGQNEDGQTFAEYEEDYDSLRRLYEPDGNFATATINGREYVLFAVPFSN